MGNHQSRHAWQRFVASIHRLCLLLSQVGQGNGSVGWACCLWFEVVWIDSRKFVETQLLGLTRSHTPHCPRQSCLVCKEKWVALLQPLCGLPRRSEFPLTLWLRQSTFAKDGWGLTCTNKSREAHRLVGRPCYEIPRVTPWPYKARYYKVRLDREQLVP